MLTGIDHATVVVADLNEAVVSFRRLGFSVSDVGTDVDEAGESAFVHFDDAYVELTTCRSAPQASGEAALATVSRSGLRGLAVGSDDIVADAAAMRTRGVAVGEIRERRLRTPSGDHLRWREAAVGGDMPLPLSLIEHHMSRQDQQRAVRAATDHPNTAGQLERAYIAVPDVREAAQVYESVLAVPAPPFERGTVIMSLMAVFYLDTVGIALAEPFGEGVTADALEAWGAGPFQLLFHAESIDSAAAFMQEQGLPAPARGVRLSGEHAVLAKPEHACGTYIALAGPQ